MVSLNINESLWIDYDFTGLQNESNLREKIQFDSKATVRIPVVY